MTGNRDYKRIFLVSFKKRITLWLILFKNLKTVLWNFYLVMDGLP